MFKGFFKKLSIEEKKERLGGLHPIAIILYLIMNCVLFLANLKITTKDIVSNYIFIIKIPMSQLELTHIRNRFLNFLKNTFFIDVYNLIF